MDRQVKGILGAKLGMTQIWDEYNRVVPVTVVQAGPCVMKRHGFHGLKASHGVERKHRSPGSIGACATPGRVFKGVRMAGRMGGVRFTTQNLTVVDVDTENNIILVKGAVPGPKGAVVLV